MDGCDYPKRLPDGFTCKGNYPQPVSNTCGPDPITGRWVYRRTCIENDGPVQEDAVDDTMVIPYNPTVQLMWDGQTCLYVCSSDSVLDYLCKYVTKAEPVFKFTVREKLCPRVVKYLKSEEGRHLWGRSVSSAEVFGRLMGFKHLYQSSQCVFLTTEIPKKRTRVVNTNVVRKMAEDAIDPDAVPLSADADVGASLSYEARHKALMDAAHQEVLSNQPTLSSFWCDSSDSDGGELPGDGTQPPVDKRAPVDLDSICYQTQVDKWFDRPEELEEVGYTDYYRYYKVVTKEPTGAIGVNYWRDMKNRYAVRLTKRRLVRLHLKLPSAKEGFFYQQLLLYGPGEGYKPFRCEQDFISEDNTADEDHRYEEECIRRGLINDTTSELDILKNLLASSKDPAQHSRYQNAVRVLEQQAKDEGSAKSGGRAQEQEPNGENSEPEYQPPAEPLPECPLNYADLTTYQRVVHHVVTKLIAGAMLAVSAHALTSLAVVPVLASGCCAADHFARQYARFARSCACFARCFARTDAHFARCCGRWQLYSLCSRAHFAPCCAGACFRLLCCRSLRSTVFSLRSQLCLLCSLLCSYCCSLRSLLWSLAAVFALLTRFASLAVYRYSLRSLLCSRTL